MDFPPTDSGILSVLHRSIAASRMMGRRLGNQAAVSSSIRRERKAREGRNGSDAADRTGDDEDFSGADVGFGRAGDCLGNLPGAIGGRGSSRE